jgi:hypothetical protein
MKSESGPPLCNRLFQPPPWHSSQGHSNWQATAHASCAKPVQVRKWFIHEQNVCSFSNIASHLNRLLLFAKHLANAYPDKEVPEKTTIHRLVTKFRDTGSVFLWQVLIERQNSWNYVRTDFKQCISCNNGIRLQEFILPFVMSFCAWIFSCIVVRVAF